MPVWVVVRSAGGTGDDFIQAYDDTTYAVLATSPLITGAPSIASIALSPDSTKLYAGDTNNGVIAVMPSATLTPVTQVTVASTASRITVYPSNDGTVLFVADRGNRTVYVLNSSTLATITSFTTTATGPTGMTQLGPVPGTGNLYIACETGNVVEVHLSTAPYTLLATIPVTGTDPLVLKQDPTFAHIYVLNILTQTIDVIATPANTLSLFTTLTGGGGAIAADMDISADNKYLYVASGAVTTDAWRVNISPVSETHFSTTNNNNNTVITKDAAHTWFSESTASTVEALTVPGNALVHTLTFGGQPPSTMVATPNPFGIGNPFFPTLTIPKLFIPRKGLMEYDYEDFDIDWRAIERWGNSWAPTLFFPNKPFGRNPTPDELTANWVQLEVWANGPARAKMVAGGIGSSWTALLVPRKDSDDPEDLTVDWVQIQMWANRL